MQNAPGVGGWGRPNDGGGTNIPARVVEFSSYGIAKDATALLESIWRNEAPQGSPAPNFARIVKESNNNVRAALMELELELMVAAWFTLRHTLCRHFHRR
jgi:hypothetical protein